MPQFADDDGLLDCYSFVVDLGNTAGPFMADLRAFHGKWDDPMVIVMVSLHPW